MDNWKWYRKIMVPKDFHRNLREYRDSIIEMSEPYVKQDAEILIISGFHLSLRNATLDSIAYTMDEFGDDIYENIFTFSTAPELLIHNLMYDAPCHQFRCSISYRFGSVEDMIVAKMLLRS